MKHHLKAISNDSEVAMAQLIYDLINSQYFPVAFGVWVFICVTWTERWKPVVNRMAKLVLKPIIFKPDSEPNSIPLYPRAFLEASANGFRNTLINPFVDFIGVLTSWLGQLAGLIYSKDHPYRILGNIFISASFLFFVFVDAVAVANTLVVLDLSQRSAFPAIFNRFDFAIAGGSLFTFIVCSILFLERRSNEGEFTSWSARDNQTKTMELGMISLTLLLSFVSLVSWSLFNLAKVGMINNSPLLDGILNWVIYGLVPINSALAAAVTFPDAVRGFIIIILILGWILIGVFYLLNALATTLGVLVPFFYDLSYRIIYVIVDILFWFMFTPIGAVLLPLRLISSNFTEGNFKE